MNRELIIEIRERLEEIFLSRLDADKTQEEFWTETLQAFESVEEEYQGTAAENYALELSVFYIVELKRLAEVKAA